MDLINRDPLVVWVVLIELKCLDMFLTPDLVRFFVHPGIEGNDVGFDVFFPRIVCHVSHLWFQVHRGAAQTDR